LTEARDEKGGEGGNESSREGAFERLLVPTLPFKNIIDRPIGLKKLSLPIPIAKVNRKRGGWFGRVEDGMGVEDGHGFIWAMDGQSEGSFPDCSDASRFEE
jgi:hypothetical protein